MNNFIKTIVSAGILGLVGASSLITSANAAIIGVAVNEIGPGATPVEDAVFAAGEGGNELGRDAIGYFIPLTNGTSGVFGADNGNGGRIGQVADTGTFGFLSMFLRFQPTVPNTAGILTLTFQDLDLEGINDPFFFLEAIGIFDADENLIIDPIFNIEDAAFTPGAAGGDDAPQQLSIPIEAALFDGTEFFVELFFVAASEFRARNTREFVIAELMQEVVETPLPGALPLFVAGLAGFSFAGRRKQSAS